MEDESDYDDSYNTDVDNDDDDDDNDDDVSSEYVISDNGSDGSDDSDDKTIDCTVDEIDDDDNDNIDIDIDNVNIDVDDIFDVDDDVDDDVVQTLNSQLSALNLESNSKNDSSSNSNNNSNNNNSNSNNNNNNSKFENKENSTKSYRDKRESESESDDDDYITDDNDDDSINDDDNNHNDNDNYDDDDDSINDDSNDDSDDDDESITQEKPRRPRIVSKIKKKNDNYFDLVDSSSDDDDCGNSDDSGHGDIVHDDEQEEKEPKRKERKGKQNWISLDDDEDDEDDDENKNDNDDDIDYDQVDIEDDSDEDNNDDNENNNIDDNDDDNHNDNGSDNESIVVVEEEKKCLTQSSSAVINLSATPPPKTKTLTSNAKAKPSASASGSGSGSTSAPAPVSNWIKTKYNGSKYYTLPKITSTKTPSSSSSSSSNDKKIPNPEIYIPPKLYKKLYDHQKIGVEWISSLHTQTKKNTTINGGILGDDMGLGKTIQSLTFIGGLMISESICNTLVVCPKSVLLNWEREARDVLIDYCNLDVEIVVLDSNIRQEKRERLLRNALTCASSRPHLVITTYGLVKSNTLHFVGGGKDDSMYWDYCILDEGHQIKNPNTQQHKSCSRICRSKHTRRLLLTGTPIQNNTKELWALFDWATSSRLLGTLKRFQNQFAIPIENGRNKNASEWTLRTAEQANKRLQQILKPHFLQRMKNAEFAKCLPKKTELVVWAHLSHVQRELYESYLVDGGQVSAVLSGETRSPLQAITYLKKLCDHPSLVTDEHARRGSELNKSAKLDILLQLMKSLRKDGHRCLIFSPSTKILDIIEVSLSQTIKLARIDGSTKGKDRQSIVDNFNREGSVIDAMLLSTKAAGIGLNLTSADRAIIFSPSWNPADDSQAVDRCYRIGQRKDVVVYRFITAGTVEERMYDKQVYKDGIRRTLTTTSGCATERHFNEEDLRKMFQLKPRGVCEMLDKIKRVKSPLESFEQVVGVSSHDSVYYRTVINVDCPPSDSPFAGTPAGKTKMSRSTLAKMTAPESDLVSKIAGLSLSSRDQVRNDAVPLRKVKTPMTKIRVAETKNHARGKENAEFTKQLHTHKTSNLCTDARVERCFERIDKLTTNGKIEASLLILFRLLECEELKGDQKLLVHKKISSRAILFHEWHKRIVEGN